MLLLLSISAPMWSQESDSFLSFEPSELSPAQLEMLTDFEVEIDTVQENIGILLDADLTGFSTYRIYITTSTQDDKVSSIYGNVNEPMTIETSGSFFQSSPLGGTTPAGIVEALWGSYPSNEFDSFVTIGIDQPASNSQGQSDITILESGNDSWVANFEPEDDSNGSSFEINDLTGGGWFTLPSATNGIGGPAQRVLIAQLTTDGDLSGNINAQIFLDGDNINGTVYLPFTLSNPGCTDNLACNYDETANSDNGSCVFANEPCETCDGGLVASNDSDSDGICDDIDTCEGTLDACGVCNGPGETFECGCDDIADGACDCAGNQLDALGVCGGDCAADTDGDGICDDVDDCIGALDACGVCNGPVKLSNAVAMTSPTVPAIARATSWTPSASAVATARLTPMVTASATTWTTALVHLTLAACATALVKPLNAVAMTSPTVPAIARATSWTPSASAVATAQLTPMATESATMQKQQAAPMQRPATLTRQLRMTTDHVNSNHAQGAPLAVRAIMTPQPPLTMALARHSMLAANVVVMESLPEIAIATAIKRMPWAYVAENVKEMLIPMAFATTKTIALAKSTNAANVAAMDPQQALIAMEILSAISAPQNAWLWTLNSKIKCSTAKKI